MCEGEIKQRSGQSLSILEKHLEIFKVTEFQIKITKLIKNVKSSSKVAKRPNYL